MALGKFTAIIQIIRKDGIWKSLSIFCQFPKNREKQEILRNHGITQEMSDSNYNFPVLYSAPPIPAGIHWNPLESARECHGFMNLCGLGIFNPSQTCTCDMGSQVLPVSVVVS